MSPELARLALTFLARTQIQGSEAPAMMQVVQALQMVAMPQPPATPPAAPADPGAAKS